MSSATPDGGALIFLFLALGLVCWAVLDTKGFFRLLSLGRKTTFTRFELLAIRVPGVVAIIGACLMIVDILRNKR